LEIKLVTVAITTRSIQLLDSLLREPHLEGLSPSLKGLALALGSPGASFAWLTEQPLG